MAENHEELIEELINPSNVGEDFEHAFDDENKKDTDLLSIDDNKFELKTHNKVKSSLCGTILEVQDGYAKVTLQTTKEMTVDEMGLVHSGFIFTAADYAAAIAVNEENVVIIGSRCKFLAPAKVEDLITFEAKSKFEDTRKREIKVMGYINEIKVFEAIFQAVILENHIFKTKIKGINRRY